MVARTGADPTLEGGGEFARETDVVVIDALSETISLPGVPDLSSLETDARLGWRDGRGSPGGYIEVADEGADNPVTHSVFDGSSAFGVGNTLNVLGAFRTAGDESVVEAGVLGGSAGKSEGTVCLIVVSEFDDFGLVSLVDCITDCTVRLRTGADAAVEPLTVGLEPDRAFRDVEDEVACFFTIGVATIVDLFETDAFVAAGSFGFPDSSEGKSSGCKAMLV